MEAMDSREFVFGRLMGALALGCTPPALNHPADPACIIITVTQITKPDRKTLKIPPLPLSVMTDL